MITCELCGEQLGPAELLAHLRRMHPDADAEPDQWPDGRPVIVDLALTPDEFRQAD